MKKLLVLIFAFTFGLASPVFANGVTYTIQSGDTLSEIARDHGMSLDDILEVNSYIRNPDLIFPDDILILSPTSTTSSLGSDTQTTASITDITAYERDLLARIVYAEARGESYQGKVAVAHVVLNRVDSHNFPNSIESVIYQSGQFQPVSNGAINQRADEDSVRAVQEALSNRGNNQGSIYFYNPHIATSSWIFTRQTVKTIGNHVFAK